MPDEIVVEKPKRKTRTSNEVKKRYNMKTYDRLTIVVRKDIAQEYKRRCMELGLSYSQPLHKAIEDFLAKTR